MPMNTRNSRPVADGFGGRGFDRLLELREQQHERHEDSRRYNERKLAAGEDFRQAGAG